MTSKEYHREYSRQHYRDNKVKYVEKNRKRKEMIQAEVQQYKEDNPCTDCGQFYPHYIMEFDHLEPPVNGKRVGHYITSGSRKGVWAEIEKCELVCANCHAARTHFRRTK